MEQGKQISFDRFRLDAGNQQLWRDDQIIPLRPKPFSVLEYLAQRPGQLVTKEELLDAVWPETSVSDSVLKVCIREIREALGDDAATPLFIETAHRRGYRFVATAAEAAGEADLPNQGPGIQRQSPPRLIAVLPFKPLGSNADDEYLGLGIADALVTKLGNIKQVIVRPTSAVRKYTSPEQDPVVAGRELRVEAVLEGSIQSSGDRMRVTVQLVDVRIDAPLWSDKFDVTFTDIFAVEDSISEKVTEALTLKLNSDEKEQLRKHHTQSTAAYQLYLKGRYYWTKRTSEGLKKGTGYFQQAIDTDPGYALAYSGLADCYAQLSWVRLLAPREAFPKSKAAAGNALRLDPMLAEAHTSLAWARMIYDWEWLDSELEFKRAIDLNPNYALAHLWYAVLLIVVERYSEAFAQLRQAEELDPLSPLINTIKGWPFYFMGRYREAVEQYRNAFELDAQYLPARLLLGWAYEQMGEFSKAVAEFEQLKATDDTPLVLAALGHAYAASGRRLEALTTLDELNVLSRRRYVSPYDVAVLHAGLGDQRRACEWLEKAVEDRSSWLVFARVEPKLSGLRGDPRFANVLQRVGLA